METNVSGPKAANEFTYLFQDHKVLCVKGYEGENKDMTQHRWITNRFKHFVNVSIPHLFGFSLNVDF